MSDRKQKNVSLVLLLCTCFIIYLGLGLVFPLFTFLLFDVQSGMLPVEAGEGVRGLWLGILLALAPAVLFFASPLMGTLSDIKGRKVILKIALGVGIVSYVLGVIAVIERQLFLLILSRVLYGISAGSSTVLQASIVDISSGKDKQKNFGLYSMALGAGMSFGPLLGGFLAKPDMCSWCSYSTPFVVAAVISLINWLVIIGKFKESHPPNPSHRVAWAVGFLHLKKAFQMEKLRMMFLVMFLFFFGWNFFTEFISVFLMKRFEYSQLGVGAFYAYTGVLFALCAGFLIRPIIKRFPPRRVLEMAMILGGLYFFLFLPIERNGVMWVYLLPLIFCIALIYPTATTVISNAASEKAQGEVLGIYSSIQSVAFIVSPFGAGGLVAKYPFLCIVVAGATMILSGLLLAISRGRYFFNKSPGSHGSPF